MAPWFEVAGQRLTWCFSWGLFVMEGYQHWLGVSTSIETKDSLGGGFLCGDGVFVLLLCLLLFGGRGYGLVN